MCVRFLAVVGWLAFALCAQERAGEGQPAGDRIKQLMKMSARKQSNAPAESRAHAAEALDLAIGANDRVAEAAVRNQLGIACYYLGEYGEAMSHYRASLAIAEELEIDARIADSLNNIGVVHYVLGEHGKTLDYYTRVLTIRRRMEDRNGTAVALNNIGNVYHATGKSREALDYFSEALAIYEGLAVPDRLASTLNNAGLALIAMGQEDEARARFERAHEIGKDLGDKAGLAFSLNNLGMVLDKLGRPEEAWPYYEQSLELRREIGDRPGIAIGLHNLGQALVRSGDPDKALDYLRQGLAIAREIGVKAAEFDILLTMAKIHEQSGALEEAVAAHKQLAIVREDLLNETTAKRLADLRALHEVERKDRELDALRARREADALVRNLAIGGAVLLVLVVGLLINLNRHKDRANREMHKAHESLATAQAERERAIRAELTQATRLATLGELAASLTHELRTPIMGISLNARATQKIASAAGPHEDLEEALADIEQGASTAHEILNRLRELIRHGEVRREQVHVDALIRDLEPLARSDLEARGARLEITVDPRPMVVSGDAVQLQQVIMNLLHNGADAAADVDAAAVALQVAQNGDGTIEIAVSDNGPAVAETTVARMFDPMFTTKPDGMGMGLRICKTIVTAHGGRLWAAANPGGGLSVKFSLPCA